MAFPLTGACGKVASDLELGSFFAWFFCLLVLNP